MNSREIDQGFRWPRRFFRGARGVAAAGLIVAIVFAVTAVVPRAVMILFPSEASRTDRLDGIEASFSGRWPDGPAPKHRRVKREQRRQSIRYRSADPDAGE